MILEWQLVDIVEMLLIHVVSRMSKVAHRTIVTHKLSKNLLILVNFFILILHFRIYWCGLYYAWRSYTMQESKSMSVCYFHILADHRLLALSSTLSCAVLWCFRRRRDLWLMNVSSDLCSHSKVYQVTLFFWSIFLIAQLLNSSLDCSDWTETPSSVGLLQKFIKTAQRYENYVRRSLVQHVDVTTRGEGFIHFYFLCQ